MGFSEAPEGSDYIDPAWKWVWHNNIENPDGDIIKYRVVKD